MYLEIICGIIVALILGASPTVDATSNVCQSPTCVQEAGKIIGYVDSKANPCNNPYELLCGNLNEKPEEEIWFDDLKNAYSEKVHDDDHEIVKVAKKLYQGCLDEREVKDDLKTIKQTLKQIGGWPVLEDSNWKEADFDWLSATYALRRLGYHFGAFLDVKVEGPFSNKEYVLAITQGENQHNNMDFVEIVQMFKEYNKETLQKDAADVYQFLNDFNELYQGINVANNTIEEIQKTEGSIDWLAFINNISYPAIEFTKDDYIWYPKDQQIERMIELILKTPKRVVANYLMWQAVVPLIRFVPNYSLYDSSQKRTDFCLHQIYAKIVTKGVTPMGIVMARRYLSEEKKKSMKNIAKAILWRVEENIKPEVFPYAAKQIPLYKLKETQVLVGINATYDDDKILDEFQVDMNVEENASFFALLSQVNRNLQSTKYVKARKVMPNYASSLMEYPDHKYGINLLYVPLTTISDHFYNENRPQYLNYGIFGTILSYDLIRHYARLKQDPETIPDKVTECLLKDLKIDSPIFHNDLVWDTILEHIAMQVSYAAYEEWVENMGDEEQLIAVEYTPKQLFWISAARTLCKPRKGENIDTLSESLRQNPNFAKDFNCPVNSKMNPTTRCNIL